MNSIELAISPGRQAGFKLRFAGPAGWDEVTARQAIGLMRLRTKVNDAPELLFPALKLLYGMKARHQRWLFDEKFLRRKGVHEGNILLTLEVGQLLIDSIRWAGETDPGSDFLVNRFRLYDFRFGNPLALLKRLFYRKSYHAPADALADLTFGEFMLSDQAYQKGDLVRLVAVLYGPRISEERMPLDPKAIALRTNQFSVLEPALVQLIAAHYAGSLRYLQRCFPFVFPKRQPEEETEAEKSKKPAGTWLDVAINMAKLDATKVKEIEKVNLYLALKVLNEQLRQAEELEAALEKNKK